MPTELIHVGAGQYTNMDDLAVRQGNVSLVNWMVDDAGGLVSRPGMTVLSTALPSLGDSVTTVYVRTLFAYKDYIIIVRNNGTVYAMIEDGTATDITGANRLIGPATPPHLSVDSDGSLLLARGGAPQRWSGILGDRCEALGGFAPNATHLAVIQGYLVGNDSGNDEIYYSTVADHGSFDVLRVFQAESRRDPCIAIVSSQNFIYLFGTETTDVYYPTNSDSPAFARAYTLPRGLATSRGVIDVDGSIFFMDTRRRICRLQDRQPMVISMEIEKQLLALESIDSLVVHRVDFEGRHLLVWSIEDEDIAFVYDYALSAPGKGIWSEWRGWSSTSSRWAGMPLTAYAYQPEWRRHFCGSAQVLYEMKASVGYDGSSTTGEIRRVVRTGHLNHGTTALKRSNKLRLRMARGTTTSNTATPDLMVRVRDDGREWGQYVHLSAGIIGERNTYGAEIVGMGMYRDRQWEIVTTAQSPRIALYPPEEDFEVLAR